MRMIVLALLLAPGVAYAHSGGVTFGLAYGYGTWSFDQARIAGQVGPGEAGAFVEHLHAAQVVNLHAGYNVLGYGGLKLDATATGWNLTTSDRGGGGFVGGLASFSPFNFFLAPERRWDAQLLAGYAYGLVGQTRAASGGTFDWGLRGAYFLTPNLSVGATVRFFHPGFSTFILDYDHRDDPGNTIPLPQGSGGLFWMAGAQLEILIPVGGTPH